MLELFGGQKFFPDENLAKTIEKHRFLKVSPTLPEIWKLYRLYRVPMFYNQ